MRESERERESKRTRAWQTRMSKKREIILKKEEKEEEEKEEEKKRRIKF